MKVKSKTEFDREFYNWTLANTNGLIRLRSYQMRLAYPIYKSIVEGDGAEYVLSVPRQTGKTTFIECLMHYCVNTLPFDYDRFKHGLCLGHFGPTREQIATLFRGMKHLFETEFQTKVLGMPAEISNAQNFELPNKASIRARTANITAKIESLTCHAVFIEESQDIPFVRIHKSIYPMCANTGGPKIHIGSPNPENLDKSGDEDENDYFAQLRKNLPEKYKLVITDKDVLPEASEFWKSEYRSAMDRLGAEHPLFRSQWCGEFVEVDNRFIREPQLMECKRGVLKDSELELDCFVGYDTGKLHDSTVVAVYDSTPALINFLEFLPGVDYDTQFSEISKWLKNFKVKYILGDYYNAGEALKDRLIKDGYECETLKMNDEVKSAVYTELEVDIKQKKFIYPNSYNDTIRRFEAQMLSLRRRYRGRMQIVSKPLNSSKARDDYADATAIGNYAIKQYSRVAISDDIYSLGKVI